MTEYRHLEQDKAERLKEALPGLSEDMPESFFRLAEIFEQQVFELSRKGDDFFIPYLMNDARPKVSETEISSSRLSRNSGSKSTQNRT